MISTRSAAPLRDLTSIVSGLFAGTITVALAIVAPWEYGGVEQWFRAWAAGALLLGLVAAAVHAVVSRKPGSLRASLLAALPLLALLALAGAQSLAGLPGDGSGGFEAIPHTIYPAATRLAFGGAALAAAASLIGSIVFAKRPAFDVLLLACLASAASVAFVGIAWKVTGDDKTIRGMSFLGDPFACFVNRNNACAFLSAGIAAGCALLRSTIENSRTDLPRNRLQTWLPDRLTRVLALGTLTAICLAGAFASRSRGGTIGALVALTAGLAFSGQTPWRRRVAIVAPLVAIAVALVAWVGLSGAAVERFRAVTVESVVREGRIPHWQDVMGAVAARPRFGAGLGTYGYAYQEFSTQPPTVWFEHADNQYVETLVEGGAVGGAIVLCGAVLALVGLTRRTGDTTAASLIASLVGGQAAHAVFDYGIVVPAVVLIIAPLWGAGMARLFSFDPAIDLERGSGRQKAARFSRYIAPQRTGPAGLAIGLTAAMAFAFHEYRLAAGVERFQWVTAHLDRRGDLDPSRLAALSTGLSAAVARRPDDAVGQRNLAEIFLYRYRSAASSAIRSVDPSLTEDDAWHAAGLISLHRAVNRVVRSGAVNGVANIRQDALSQTYLVPARRHLLAARTGCSRLPGVYIPLAATAFLDAEADPGGIADLETARTLFPADVDVLQTAATMAWQAGDIDLASRCWKASFGLRHSGFDILTASLIDDEGARQAVALTLPDDPLIALKLINDPELEIDPRLRAPLGRLLDERARGLPEGRLRQRLQANADGLQGRSTEAGELFRTLVDASPLDVDLRVDFAFFNKRQGHSDDAIEQLTTAIALDPQRSDLRQLAARWQTAVQRTDHQQR